MKTVTVSGLHKHFGKVNALDGVSLSVNKGEIFGFLGPNGAGKTTTIRCMMDFIQPSKGSVSLLGLDAHQHSIELKKRIGYIPAVSYLYDNWTGRDHVNFVAKLRGANVNQALVKSLELNLQPKTKYLSTGNRQKLSIVLAFMGNPELLILDEPTKGLDPILQNQLYNMLGDYKKEGGTVFMSSHNLGEVEKICDSIAVIRDGKVFVEETLVSLRRKSIHHVSAVFAGRVNKEQFVLPNVTVLHSAANTISLKVKGDLDKVISLMAKEKIKDLEVTHASLEELFLEMYA